MNAVREGLALTVCVPAYNEAPTLAAAVADLRDSLAPVVERLEVIIVNDGSADGTAAIADALAVAHPETVRVLHHARNQGFGVSYRDGLRASTGDWYTYFPGDHENQAAELVQAVAAVCPGVLVTTHHVSSDPRPLSRRLLSRTYTCLVNAVSGLRLRYYNGLTLFPVKDLRAIPLGAQGFLMQAEAVVRLVRRGYRVVELEYPLSQRRAGRSAAVRGPALRQAARDCVRIWRAGRTPPLPPSPEHPA